MRIDLLRLENFKRYESFELPLHPTFTLLVGENGAGKTTILDALAVALGIWLVDVPDSRAFRPGFEVVRQAILACVAGAQDVSFDADRDDVVVVLNGTRQLFSTMSAGYRMMVGLIAHLAIKAVKQNARRLPPQKLSAAEANAS